MTNSSGSRLVLAVALVVGGYALLLVALETQAYQSLASQRAAGASGGALLGPSAPSAPEARAAAGAGTAAAGAGTAAPALAAAAPSAAQGGSAPSAVASGGVVPAAATSSAGAAEDSETQGVFLFHFSAGGASMSKEEVQRLLTLAKVLAKHKDVRISIDGYPDRAGNDPLIVGIARHRAKVGQLLLTQAGVKEDRITAAAVPEIGPQGELARTIRITTTPPLTETEQP